MTLDGTSSSALHISYPANSAATSRTTSRVSVHPVALFSILDHYLRRSDPEPAAPKDAGDQYGATAAPAAPSSKPSAAAASSTTAANPTRVIGTLLGTRVENEVEIRNCFAVPHHETDELVQVDMDYHRQMLELHQRVNPEEIIVGWYATGPSLNTYSSLIQDFYSRETLPNQAVHLTVDTDVAKANTGVKAYVSAPLGLTPKAESAVFVPLPVTLLSSLAEKPALSLLASTTAPQQHGGGVMLSDMDALAASLRQVQSQLTRVLQYVRDVIDGKRKGDPVVGRYVIDAVSTVPISSSSAITQDGASQLESLFNSHLQDVLMISYLANVVRAQAEVSARLAILT
ncbi:Mov34-domain-containing protein [Ceraceosorus guamensis]|uniref:Eukaryotic translation initiation factor 3 subunit F n=1 Tax=Ceraceosorus guamensis TaxID=1522189 RepID=A0A316VTR0_9BASI|nr:Mov34-domain-containing protein [Ceraceosorus guamensis]PWN40428.1 Mov34-domain-containing protein [Ceraceosorus guamensis]